MYQRLDVGSAYRLTEPDNPVPLTRLGDLLCAAQGRFASWSLVPWFYAESARRGQFCLLAIRNQNWRGGEPTPDPEHLAKLRDAELGELCQFIRGFAAGATPNAAAASLEQRRKHPSDA